MTVKELDDKIKKGLGGVYLFYGEEEYLKRRYLEKVREVLLPDDTDAVFNHVKITFSHPLLEKNNKHENYEN